MPGYSNLARVMGKRRELGMFRRFSSLRCQSLLYMQAELLDLELELQQMIRDPEATSLDQSWSEYTQHDDNAEFWRGKFLQLREKLDAYYQALLQTAQINRLEQPRKYDFEFLHRWLNHPSGGDYFLRGIEAASFEQHMLSDMVVLSGGNEPGDSLAEYICRKIVPWYHRLLGYRLHRATKEEDFEETWEYNKKFFQSVGNAFCMFLSATLPPATILILYFAESMAARLIIMTFMSCVFSLLMSVIIGDSRGDVFAATTAFAAVQVVFVAGSS